MSQLRPFEGHDDLAVAAREVGPPPFLLGHRGSPYEAPENTLSALRRALEVGLDGIEYDVRACAGGDQVLLHDADLSRTTDGHGLLALQPVAALVGLDAGAWHSREHAGEPIPLLEEALSLLDAKGQAPLHMIELKEGGLVAGLAERLSEYQPPLRVRVASFLPDEVAAAERAGLPGMLLVDQVDEDALRLLSESPCRAIGFGPGGWRTAEFERLPRSIERWAWSVDDPDDLLAACRLGFTGLNTNEPHRALAARALHRLAPECTSWPLEVPMLRLVPEAQVEVDPARGAWFGEWEELVGITNPLPVDVEVRLGFFARHGAFEVEGLPTAFRLAPHEFRELPLRLRGGSRSPGPDPLVGALLSWRGSLGSSTADQMAPGGRLLLDAPLLRRRLAWAEPLSTRLELLREAPGAPEASVVLSRRGGRVSLSIENPGELADAILVARLGEQVVQGAPRVELVLPQGFDASLGGLPFSVGLLGMVEGERRLRRWAGGLPEGLQHGAPGLLLPVAAG